MERYRLKISNMSKSFPGVKVLDSTKLTVKPGSVHTLIGKNGADKSTLMKCLFGLYHPDSRAIEINGQVMDIKDPNDVLKSGISIIHQELNLVPYRSVVDNTWTGRFQTKGIAVDENQMVEKTRSLLRGLDFGIDVTTLTKNLSVLQMQAIEIAEAVSYNAKIVITDEPTPSLTVAKAQRLFKIIGKLRREGRSIIYISHKLGEIFEAADEVTVIGDGRYIGTWDIRDITIDQLIGQIIGRKVNGYFPVCGDVRTGEVMLRVENFTSADPHSFKNVSFDPHRGEILGIGGLVGAQRTELIEAMFNLCRITSGKSTVNGKTVIDHSSQDTIRNGSALLTEEHRVAEIIPVLSVWDNTLTVTYKKLTDNVLGYTYTKKLPPSVDKMCADLDVRIAETKTLIRNLLGENWQEALIGRWLLADCDVIMLSEPTGGVDVDAKYEVYRIMQDLVKKGKAVIMVSSKIPELLGILDRIMIMCAGKQTGILSKKEATQIEVIRYATQFDNKTEERVSV